MLLRLPYQTQQCLPMDSSYARSSWEHFTEWHVFLRIPRIWPPTYLANIARHYILCLCGRLHISHRNICTQYTKIHSRTAPCSSHFIHTLSFLRSDSRPSHSFTWSSANLPTISNNLTASEQKRTLQDIKYPFLRNNNGIHLTALASCASARHVPGFETLVASSSDMFRNSGTTFSTHLNLTSGTNGELFVMNFTCHSLLRRVLNIERWPKLHSRWRERTQVRCFY